MVTTGASVATVDHRLRLSWTVLFVLLLLGAVVGLVQPLLELPERIGRNNNEGWNAHHATRALEGDDLYPPSDALITNNYPPLSFYVVGGLGRGLDDNVRAGRILALVSLLTVAAMTGTIARFLSGSGLVGATATLLCLATIGGHFQNYVALDDPQMFGHALQYLGLGALLRGRGDRRGIVACAVLVVLGGLVKHILVAIPLGVTLWLWMERRKEFRLWAVSCLVLGSIAGGILYAVYGSSVFESVLGNERTYGIHLLTQALERWILPLAPLLVGAAGVLAVRRGPRIRLVAIIGAFSLCLGMLSSLAEGVNYNAIFDALFVAVILAPVVAHRLSEEGCRLAWLWPWVMVLPVLLVLPARALESVESQRSRPERSAIANEDLDWIEARPGRVLCEDSALSYWTERSFELDFFNFRQKRKVGLLDGNRLIGRLDARVYTVVQLDRPEATATLGPDVQDAIERNYELARQSPVNGWLFVPRTARDRSTGPDG